MTTVRHRLLNAAGEPVANHLATMVLMRRRDMAEGGYALDIPENASFNGALVQRSIIATSDVDGWLTWDLVPNEYIAPSGTYYQVYGLGTERIILWVFDADEPVELTECRLNLVDFNSSNFVVVQGPRGKRGPSGEAGPVTDASMAVLLGLPNSLTRAALIAAVAGLDLPEATADQLGVVQLGGDLAGTAEAPTVPGLVDKVDFNDPRLEDARPPLSHSHTSAAISDSTPLGRILLTTETAAAVLGILGGAPLSHTEGIVLHDGTDGGGERPSGYLRIRWVGGSTRPSNMIAPMDVWEHDGPPAVIEG